MIRIVLEYSETNWFRNNLYDMYVVNKKVNGKQCTIIWYVDDLKVSHEDEIVVKTY